MNAFQKGLHERALEIAKKYQRLESDLIEILQKLDDKKVFRVLGYSSLFQYCLRELNLSESVAYCFINVSRAAKKIPELKEEIKAGKLSISKARRIVPVITKENSSQWFEKARTLPQKKLEKEIANGGDGGFIFR